MRKFLFLLLPLTATPAIAQVLPQGEPPTAGVHNPTLGVAGEGDASAIERNPALLGTLRSWSGVYLHSELDRNQVVGGRGDGFFIASPIPYLDFLSVGAAVQLIRPPNRFPFGSVEKLSLSLAWRALPTLSFGATYAHVFSDHTPVQSGLDTLDLGLAFRQRHFAVGLVIHDVPGSHAGGSGGVLLQRVFEPELAMRPLGRGTLEFAAALRVGERRSDIDPRFRIWVSPLRGLAIKTELEWRRDLNLDGIAENDLRLSMGLEFNFAHFGLSGFGLWGRDEGTVQGHGFTLAARVSGERYPSLWGGPLYFEKILLTEKLDERALAKLLSHLRHLERDRSLEGVLLVIGDFQSGWASAEELRQAFVRLRKAGRHVFVYTAETNTKGYFIAAAAERIFQDPAGGIRLRGLSATQLFFKGTGDLLGVRADFVKIAEYKSWPEKVTRASSSDEAKQQRNDLLDDIYSQLVDGISVGRKIGAEAARKLIDSGPYTAAEALSHKLVDDLRSADELEDTISDSLGRTITLRDPPKSPAHPPSWHPPEIAVLFVDGDIVDGKSQVIPLIDRRMSGAETLLPIIDQVRDNPNVRALVLRVNSPGGSSLASDLVARALERVRAEKPVVCSFGDVAASGGYFIATPCSRIFAEPSTITGSIGIFTGKIDISGLLGKLGVTFEETDRGKHASMDSWFRLYTDEERAQILQKLRYYYNRFVATVARGRHLTEPEVDRIGRGHVWSGTRALGHKLVDQFGSLQDAVAYAGRLARISPDDVEVVPLPAEPSLFSQVLSLFGIETKNDLSLVLPLLRETLRALPTSVLVAPSIPQARLDQQLVIE